MTRSFRERSGPFVLECTYNGQVEENKLGIYTINERDSKVSLENPEQDEFLVGVPCRSSSKRKIARRVGDRVRQVY